MSEQQMTYEQYVDKLCRSNGIVPGEEATLETNEFMLAELFPELNFKAGWAEYQSRTITEEEGK